jgi:hypothetical protein
MGVSFTASMVEGVLSYVGNVWEDLKLPILVIAGLMLGFFILAGVISALLGKKNEIEEDLEHFEE